MWPEPYKDNCTDGLENHKKALQECMENLYKLQPKINSFLNYKIYLHHRNKDKISKKYYTVLFNKYEKFLDVSRDEFLSSFKDNYGSKIFELVMMDFIFNSGFELMERVEKKNKKTKNVKGVSDIECSFGGQKFFIECTTINTSRMDEFFKELPILEKFIKIGKLLKESLEKIRILNLKNYYCPFKLPGDWYDLGTLDNLFCLVELQPSIQSIFEGVTIEKMRDLIDICRYAIYDGHQFRHVIPEKLLNDLMNIFPQTKMYSYASSRNFLKGRITTCIRQKLGKSYSKEGVPIVIAISLGLLPDEINTFSDSNPLIKELIEEIKKLVFSDTLNIENLYAIIINATAYDWLPKEHKNNSDENTFFIIYNYNCKLTGLKNIFSKAIDVEKTHVLFEEDIVV